MEFKSLLSDEAEDAKKEGPTKQRSHAGPHVMCLIGERKRVVHFIPSRLTNLVF
jgi:hypothetical protein